MINMAAPSTKQRLRCLVDDVEIIAKELFEIMALPKQQRADSSDTAQLIDLLVHKDKEVKDTLKTAEGQAEVQKTMDSLKAEVDKRDTDIRQLQKNLKEAENILAAAIYQSKQKLKSVTQASTNRISSEDLIKYAHKISASNAVAAPPSWAPGDHRRPYPTDIDMRMGFLGRLSDLPINNQTHQSQAGGAGSFPDPIAANRATSQLEHLPTTQAGSLSWQPSHDHGSSFNTSAGSSQSHSPASARDKSQNKENEDVELMSSDSSSSSSSDE